MTRRIAVFSGPTATIQNTPPLVTSNKARARAGLPLLPGRFDAIRAQRLAKPVTVYVEMFSGHPLESDAAELYGSPDGWLDADGTFHTQPTGPDDTPVFEVELRPDDGLYLLPYMAMQADGSPWEDTTAYPGAPESASRQTFFPDASRIYEEIERFGLTAFGSTQQFGDVEFDFYRPAPSGGYKKGQSAEDRTDVGEGPIEPEAFADDFFAYFPFHLNNEPHLRALADATNLVADVMATGEYDGGQWLEGSPTTEESMYWMSLVIDTTAPLVGHCAQRPHQTTSADGARNIVDGVKYVLSGIALDEAGLDTVGAVQIIDEMVITAREVTKTDARPGNYEATGGHGGVVADMGGYGPPDLTYRPVKLHTHRSRVNRTRMPNEVAGVAGKLDAIETTTVSVKDDGGALLAAAMPQVSIAKFGRYSQVSAETDPRLDPEIISRIEFNLANAALAGFVGEGQNPYGIMNPVTDNALLVAMYAGFPVVKVGRGNTAGMAYKNLYGPFIAGNNLTSTKARLLLMAALLTLGALPPAADPFVPTEEEQAATAEAAARYQEIFDTH
ncbi:MAG: asparaginase domain-containing protein [Actinomycetota bacterium]